MRVSRSAGRRQVAGGVRPASRRPAGRSAPRAWSASRVRADRQRRAVVHRLQPAPDASSRPLVSRPARTSQVGIRERARRPARGPCAPAQARLVRGRRRQIQLGSRTNRRVSARHRLDRHAFAQLVDDQLQLVARAAAPAPARPVGSSRSARTLPGADPSGSAHRPSPSRAGESLLESSRCARNARAIEIAREAPLRARLGRDLQRQRPRAAPSGVKRARREPRCYGEARWPPQRNKSKESRTRTTSRSRSSTRRRAWRESPPPSARSCRSPRTRSSSTFRSAWITESTRCSRATASSTATSWARTRAASVTTSRSPSTR